MGKIKIRPYLIDGEWVLYSAPSNYMPLSKWYRDFDWCRKTGVLTNGLSCITVNMFVVNGVVKGMSI